MLKSISRGLETRVMPMTRRSKLLVLAGTIVLLVAAIAILPATIQYYAINREAPPDYQQAGLSPSLGEIDKQAGRVLLSSSGGRELYLEPASLNLRVVDIKSGQIWNSILQDNKSGDIEKSPLVIKFLGRDSAMYEWDAYKYAIQNGRYGITRIDQGARIEFDFLETESYRLNEYMPTKISMERYSKVFLERLEEKVQQGEITPARALKYKEALGIAYQKDEGNQLYYFKFSGLPPLSLVKDLIQFSKDVEYTTDMLVEDSQQYGITVSITEPARFKVTMEAVLEEGDLVVKIPTYEIVSGNDFYTMQNISVLPSFGLVSAEKVEDGYVMVPDGSGALFQLNTFNGKFPEYDRPLYNNTYYNTLYELPEFPENLTMPVFGLYYKDPNGKSQGHLGIVEEGAELGHIKVQLGTKDTATGGTPYNKVFSTFDSMQYSRVKVFGPYSDNEARFLATTGLIPVDYTVRYKLFAEEVDYYELAITYKEYLMKKHNLTLAYNTTPKLFLDVLGTLPLEKRVLGIPYTEPYSMTKYNQLLAIMQDLDGMDKVVNYRGFFNKGFYNTLSNQAELVPENGSKEELSALLSYFKEKNQTLLFHVDLMRVSDTSGGFRPKTHGLYGYDGKPLELMRYNYASGRFNPFTTKQYLLNPLYLSDTVDKFLKSSEDYPNLFVNDLGSTYYAHYNPREIVDPIRASSIVEHNLRKLNEVKALALDNPNMDLIGYMQLAANISRESSNYATMYSTIPFRQLVMNGLVEYTTLNVNMSASRSRYFLLQALELGSLPKFTISAENGDVLKNSEFSDYISIEYSTLKESIKALYEEYSKGLSQLGSKEIAHHRMLSENVFETRYASGASVIVNYNKYPVTVLGSPLEALGYRITPAR